MMSLSQLVLRINQRIPSHENHLTFNDRLIVRYFMDELEQWSPVSPEETEKKKSLLNELAQRLKNSTGQSADTALEKAGVNAALMAAIDRNDAELLSAALHAGADVNYRETNQTVLYRAIQFKRFAMAEKLILAGSDANASVSYGQNTLLVSAVLANHLPLVRLLIEKGAEVNRRSHAYHITALYAAITSPGVSLELFEYLLNDEGIELNYCFLGKHCYFMTVLSAGLSATLQTSDNRKLKALLKSPRLNTNHNTDLISAIDMGCDRATIQLMLTAGFKWDRTAFRQAVCSGNREIIALAVNGCQCNELMMATIWGDRRKVKHLLANAQLEERNKLGQTAFMLAVDNERQDIMELLSHAKANVDVEDAQGLTLLLRVMTQENYPLAERLVILGADAKKKNEQGQSVLEQAILHNQVSLVKSILSFRQFTLSPEESKRGLASDNPEIKLLFKEQLAVVELKMALQGEIERLRTYGFWAIGNMAKARRVSDALQRVENAAHHQITVADCLHYKEKGNESIQDAISHHRMDFFGKTKTQDRIDARISKVLLSI